jgi:phosphate transport system substrate-binding protein
VSRTKLSTLTLLVLLSSTALFAEAATVHLAESGSTLLFPMMNRWVDGYTKLHPDVEIGTEASGSGKGVADAIAGSSQIGASDAYMSAERVAKTPMLNIPLAISAVFVAYNVPGANDAHLRLSGPILARIYDGTIRYWDDPRILAANRESSAKLSHHAIVKIHRYEGSGDTFIFTQFLSFADETWAKRPGYATSINWSGLSDSFGAFGNTGMVEVCKDVPYSIAYVGISYLDQAEAGHVGEAALQNRDGKWVLPTDETVAAAATAFIDHTPRDERISLVFAPGTDSYPMVNYEYAIVAPRQRTKDVADELAHFLGWIVSPSGGSAPDMLHQVHFIALPERIMQQSLAQIAQIGGG